MDKDTLAEAKESFKAKVDAESEQRKVSQDDLEFAILGKQWPAETENQRQKEGRPCLTINRLPAFLKQVTNDARMNRPSMQAKPVGSGATQDTANILNDLFRNIETQSQADIVYDTALEFAAACGIGYFIIRADYTCDDTFDQDIILERVNNPFSIYGDENSKSATSEDWNSAFITDWYSGDAFKKKWKDAKAASFEAEKSDDGDWFDGKRVRVAEWWQRDEVETMLLKLSNGMVIKEPEFLKIQELLSVQGVQIEGSRPAKTYKVTQKIITGMDVLEENDWSGKYIPIVPMYGEEVNVNGKRHFISLVRRSKDPQRMFNYWRTASTELVALAPKAPWVGAVGQFATDHRWGTANTQTHQYLEYDPVPNAGPPQRQPFAGVPAGALQEALNASDDMKAIMGMYDASLGARSNETSGRAIMARQREGDTATFNFIDNRNRAVEHGARIVLDLIPKIYNVPRIVRCIKETGDSYTVPINQPAQVQETPPGQPDIYSPAQQHIEGVTRIFDLTVGKYDVTVTAGPSFTTKRQESAEQMMEFIRVFPQAAPLIGDLLAKNLDWPGADAVAERLKAMLPPQAQGQIQPIVQQLQQQLQAQGQQAQQAMGQLQQQLQQLSTENQNLKNDKALEAEKLRIDAFNAETNRIKAVGALQSDQKKLELDAIQAMNASTINSMPAVPPGMVS